MKELRGGGDSLVTNLAAGYLCLPFAASLRICDSTLVSFGCMGAAAMGTKSSASSANTQEDRQTLAAAALLLMIAFAQPIVGAFAKPPQGWEEAIGGTAHQGAQSNPHAAGVQTPRWYELQAPTTVPVASSAAAEITASPAATSSSPAVDFGRELDTLTSFYEVVIGFLLALLTLVAALAFWTIKVVSKAQAEDAALQAAREVLGGHDAFGRRLKEVVDKAVELRMEDVYDNLESYAVSPDAKVRNPDLGRDKGKSEGAAGADVGQQGNGAADRSGGGRQNGARRPQGRRGR